MATDAPEYLMGVNSTISVCEGAGVSDGILVGVDEGTKVLLGVAVIVVSASARTELGELNGVNVAKEVIPNAIAAQAAMASTMFSSPAR